MRNGYFWGGPASFATSYMVRREDRRTNNRTMLPALTHNATAACKSPVRTELLKSAGILVFPIPGFC